VAERDGEIADKVTPIDGPPKPAAAGGDGDGSGSTPHGKRIRDSLLTGLLFTFLILFVKWCAEHTTLYQNIQLASYSWLQSKLSPPRSRKDLPVVILDISSLAPEIKEVEGEKFSVTPREPLQKLIEAVAAQKPKAIGVDIEFAPNKFGYRDPVLDPQFFRSCLDIHRNQGIHVYLGIHSSRTKSPKKWLGSEEFSELAVSIMVPDDNRKMIEWVRPGGETKPGQTMCSAIAGVFKRSVGDPPAMLGWAVERISEEKLNNGLETGEFLVDFSPIEALKDFRLKTINPDVIADQGWTLTDKAVLIGDGSGGDAEDTFNVPISDQSRPVKGVYLHASAVYTLVQSPLYELTTLGRIVTDLLLSLIVILLVTLVRLRYQDNATQKVAERRVQYLFTFLVTVIAIIAGVIFVRITRIIWDDFLFVILALWLHPSVEHVLIEAWRVVRKNASVIAKRLFLKGREQE
jgi:CHASE2 domain-containing sensor protein